MKDITISINSTAKELEPMVTAVHELIGMPTTGRSLKKKGIRMEMEKVLDFEYTGPLLEEVLKTNKTVRAIPKEGTYKGIPVIVSPIRNEDNEVIAAIGVVDLAGVVDISSAFSEYPKILDEVEEAKKRIG
jgi:hypothetical protein